VESTPTLVARWLLAVRYHTSQLVSWSCQPISTYIDYTCPDPGVARTENEAGSWSTCAKGHSRGEAAEEHRRSQAAQDIGQAGIQLGEAGQSLNQDKMWVFHQVLGGHHHFARRPAQLPGADAPRPACAEPPLPSCAASTLSGSP
jgi:hypothetical protein